MSDTTAASADRQTHTVDDVTRQNVHAMRQPEEAAKAKRTTADRVASVIARFCGSMTFVVLHVLLFAGWTPRDGRT